jgi:hypothetical protein
MFLVLLYSMGLATVVSIVQPWPTINPSEKRSFFDFDTIF